MPSKMEKHARKEGPYSTPLPTAEVRERGKEGTQERGIWTWIPERRRCGISNDRCPQRRNQFVLRMTFVWLYPRVSTDGGTGLAPYLEVSEQRWADVSTTCSLRKQERKKGRSSYMWARASAKAVEINRQRQWEGSVAAVLNSELCSLFPAMIQ